MNTSKLKLTYKVLKVCRRSSLCLPPACRNIQTACVFLQKETYADVVIVGGGMVGTALSCALANSELFHDRKVIVLEGGRRQHAGKIWSHEQPFENRVSSITPGSASFLNSIGVWDKVLSRRCHRYEKMHVWDGASPAAIDLNASDVNASEMAYMVENTVLVESCMERATEFGSTVQIQFNSKVADIHLPHTRSGEEWNLVEVQLENGDIIKSKLLVGADGPNSIIRNKANIETVDYDYNQSAVVANLAVNCKGFPNNTAWQRFLPTGPIALLPLSEDVCSLAWSTTREHARTLVHDDEETFVAKVNDALCESSGQVAVLDGFLQMLTSVIQPGRVASNKLYYPPTVSSVYPRTRGLYRLQQIHSPFYVKSRLALVGDSAHRVHVLAGLGVNLGIGDVKSLVKGIETSITEGEDYGSLDALLPYETHRQQHNVSVMAAINGLHHLFSTTFPPVVLARTLGLQATDSLKFVKGQIIQTVIQ